MPLRPGIFQPVVETLERAFRQIETKVPPPQRKPSGDSFVFRYAEQTIQQAIVQLAMKRFGNEAVRERWSPTMPLTVSLP
jgi:hypothetical protein